MSQFSTKFCRFFWIFFLSGGFFVLASGQNSPVDRFELSLLTCGPGEDLYSIFGHSALRVRDQLSGSDIVYNYGVFDFDEPGFMWKFMRGKLRYKLGINRFDRFRAAYEREGRSISENVLLLSPLQEQKLIAALQENYQPENRYYLYDFYYDNCATRIRDIIESSVDSVHIAYGDYRIDDCAHGPPSYRETLDLFTCPHFPWTDLGMDLILGLNTEKDCDARGSMYLPDYLQFHLEQYKNGDHGLLGPRTTILAQRLTLSHSRVFHPLIVFALLYVIFGIGSKLYPRHRVWNIIDPALLIIYSIMGGVFLFMHFGTDHASTRWNMNILWALPVLWMGIRYLHLQKLWKYFTYYYAFVALSLLAFLQDGPFALSLIGFIPAIIGLRRGWWAHSEDTFLFHGMSRKTKSTSS